MERPYKAGQKLRVTPPLEGLRKDSTRRVQEVSLVRVVLDDGHKITIKADDPHVQLCGIHCIHPEEKTVNFTLVEDWEPHV